MIIQECLLIVILKSRRLLLYHYQLRKIILLFFFNRYVRLTNGRVNIQEERVKYLLRFGQKLCNGLLEHKYFEEVRKIFNYANSHQRQAGINKLIRRANKYKKEKNHAS